MKRIFTLFIVSLCLCASAFAQNSPLKILEKPTPELPENYGTLDVQGMINLRVEFLADGKIGEITPISSLTRSLTELAIEAARKIKFEPEIKNGEPVTVKKIVQYFYSWRNAGWGNPDQADDGEKEDKSSKKPDDYGQGNQKFEGRVILRVTFLASGEAGDVEIVSGLSDEFNRQAVAAARKIKFKPARKDGNPVSVTKTVEYTFFSDYRENDPELKANAEITSRPAPKHPKDGKFALTGGKVYLTVGLQADGKVSINRIKSDLPKEYQDNAREAALKIKFTPAVAQDGRKVTQIKEIEYEFKPKND